MKKNNIYTIDVYDAHICTSYTIPADTFKEASEKAKKKFVKEFYNPKKVKCHMADKTQNI